MGTPVLEGCRGYSQIFIDIFASVCPGSLLNTIFGSEINWNCSEWYNYYFFQNSTYSRAFTLVGEGYVIDGIVGVFILFFVIGTFINWMYKKSNSGVIWSALYMYTSISMISSFRGDAAAILSSIIRIPLFVHCILWFMKKTHINEF